MRLNHEEHQSIIEVAKGVFQFSGWTLYLFGSRTISTLRGGDIDLLFVTTADKLQMALGFRTTFLAELKERIGDQKIDVVVCADSDVSGSAFLSDIFQKAIKLIQVA